MAICAFFLRSPELGESLLPKRIVGLPAEPNRVEAFDSLFTETSVPSGPSLPIDPIGQLGMSCLWNPEVPVPGFPVKQCLESGVPKNRVRGAAPSRSGPREADPLQPPKAFPAQSPRAFIDPLS